METFPMDSFKMVEAQIIRSSEGKVIGVMGEAGDEVWVMESRR